MIPWYSTEKVRALDGLLNQAGIPGLVLMERVGSGIADFIMRRSAPLSALILAGAGNNGGDGFVIARILLQLHWNVSVLLSHEASRSRGDAAVNLERLRAMNADILQSSDLDDSELSELIERHELIVDALLGTGASGVPRGETGRLIRCVNERRHGRGVLAVDLPSGIESGEAGMEARWTCTAAARKLPFATGFGAAQAGEVHVIPLDERADGLLGESSAEELTAADVRAMLPRRRADDHKGSRGGVLIAAGSQQYRGAAILAARGALRMGAGLVVLASVPEVLDSLTGVLPEVIPEPLSTGGEMEEVMTKWSRRCHVLLVGSGLGRDERARKICRTASLWNGPSLWDGDGLHWLAEYQLKPRMCCLTPHEGEAAALLGKTGKVTDRFAAAAELSERYGTVILKGFHSLVSEKGCKTLIVPRGDRTLSIPGSGDVLAGAASALLASGIPARSALAAAAWCHGTAGENLGRLRGQDGVLAHEVADELPSVLKGLSDDAENA
jgi:hydroxyethylthiazole kinase-like uncharacterized protein yjeF